MATWRWIRSGTGGPAWNMALDEAILRAGTVRPTLRTYLWSPPTLSLGYFQGADPETVREFRSRGFGVVRRPTGGGAIFHADELTYAVVCPTGTPGLPNDALGGYEVFHGAIVRAFAKLGVETGPRGDRELLSDTGRGDAEFWCFYHSTEFDLVREGRKLVGSAQRRTGRAFLQHGSILTGRNLVTPDAAFADVDREVLAEALAEELARTLGVGIQAAEPTEEEARAALRLEESRYASDNWTLRRPGGRTVE